MEKGHWVQIAQQLFISSPNILSALTTTLDSAGLACLDTCLTWWSINACPTSSQLLPSWHPPPISQSSPSQHHQTTATCLIKRSKCVKNACETTIWAKKQKNARKWTHFAVHTIPTRATASPAITNTSWRSTNASPSDQYTWWSLYD